MMMVMAKTIAALPVISDQTKSGARSRSLQQSLSNGRTISSPPSPHVVTAAAHSKSLLRCETPTDGPPPPPLALWVTCRRGFVAL